MVNIVKDKDLIYYVKDYDIVLVGVNIMNTKGDGFQYQVHLNFPEVYKTHRDSNYADVKKIGTVSVVPGKPTFCLCYISKGRYRPDKIPDAVDYEGLESCLNLIAKHFNGKKIASTIMGVSNYEGGGDKRKILKIFRKVFTETDITLYDYIQKGYKEIESAEFNAIVNDRKEEKISVEEYYELMKKYIWKKKFGLYVPMPEGKTYNEIKKITRNKTNS